MSNRWDFDPRKPLQLHAPKLGHRDIPTGGLVRTSAPNRAQRKEERKLDSLLARLLRLRGRVFQRDRLDAIHAAAVLLAAFLDDDAISRAVEEIYGGGVTRGECDPARGPGGGVGRGA